METSSNLSNAGCQVTVVPEEACQAVIGRKQAFEAVEAVFASMAGGSARNFPVVREAIGHADALYGFKSGFDRAGMVLGVKSGGYWPGNARRGLTNHQSTVVLFDPDTGRLAALVGGNYLTAVRTAAASAVSIAHLARKDARVLGMVGAGHQSTFQLRAALEQRNFDQVVGWNRDPENLVRLAAVCEEQGIPFEAVSLPDLAARSDVIVTITSAFEPLLMSEWVKPGTHIACMGTDTKGKQEVDPMLYLRAEIFTDEVAQATSIGESQHAAATGILAPERIIAIGEVINGKHPGRRSEQDITLFDGTGVGLQDLAVASMAAKLAGAEGLVERFVL
ncbi:MAG: ornithine cyclodeaminase family protein [Marinobacter sp.]|uniref:iminosuccinate reductase BhcD n=1 Tax=Marinobacter sp. TaxID=50741 RepID=UPI00396D21D4